MGGSSGLSADGGQQKQPAFIDVVSLLADPDRLKAEYEKLENARAQAEAIVSLVAPASDITRLREEAAADRALAAQLVSDAKSQAASIKTSAEESAKSITTSAAISADANRKLAADMVAEASARQEYVSGLVSRAEQRAQELADKEKELSTQRAELLAAETSVAAREDALRQRSEDVSQLLTELRARLDKLK